MVVSSRVRCPTHSVCVPLQCGTSVSVSQFTLPPARTSPRNSAERSGAACARGAPKWFGCTPSKSSGSASDNGSESVAT
jgi:hypothetical protein